VFVRSEHVFRSNPFVELFRGEQPKRQAGLFESGALFVGFLRRLMGVGLVHLVFTSQVNLIVQEEPWRSYRIRYEG